MVLFDVEPTALCCAALVRCAGCAAPGFAARLRFRPRRVQRHAVRLWWYQSGQAGELGVVHRRVDRCARSASRSIATVAELEVAVCRLFVGRVVSSSVDRRSTLCCVFLFSLQPGSSRKIRTKGDVVEARIGHSCCVVDATMFVFGGLGSNVIAFRETKKAVASLLSPSPPTHPPPPRAPLE